MGQTKWQVRHFVCHFETHWHTFHWQFSRNLMRCLMKSDEIDLADADDTAVPVPVQLYDFHRIHAA